MGLVLLGEAMSALQRPQQAARSTETYYDVHFLPVSI